MEKIFEHLLKKSVRESARACIEHKTENDVGALKFTKSPVHLEGQCYPSKLSSREYSQWPDHIKKIDEIADPLKKNALNERIREHDIHIVGIDLSISEHRALRAIQKLLTVTNYQGNIPEKSRSFDGNNAFHFTGNIGLLKVSVVDYLVAYDVNKKVAGDGKSRFNSHEREEALSALPALAAKMFYFYFTKKHWHYIAGRKEEKIDVIQTVAPLFKLYHYHKEMSVEEFEDLLIPNLSQKKNYSIVIEPAPIMMLDIDNYFMLIPPYEKEIRIASGGKRIPKEVYTFVSYLIYHAEIRRGKKYHDWSNITVTLPTLVYKLRLERYFQRTLRNPAKAIDIIKKAIDLAQKTGYLIECVIEPRATGDLYTFILNPNKFYQQKI